MVRSQGESHVPERDRARDQDNQPVPDYRGELLPDGTYPSALAFTIIKDMNTAGVLGLASRGLLLTWRMCAETLRLVKRDPVVCRWATA